MLCWIWQGKKFSVTGLFLGVVLSAGCNQGSEAPPVPTPATEGPSSTVTVSSPTASDTPSPVTSAPTTSTSHSVVLASRELGMSVSGPGAGSPGRTLDVLEYQINIFLPEIRDVYERARVSDPALMGSLDIIISIEANGAVSEVRFPVKRVSHERLTAAIFDQIRNWVFPQAEVETQFRFTMLFIPPGIDEASILLWEKRLGSRPVIEKPAEPAASVAMATSRLSEKEGGDTNPRNRGEESLSAPKPTSVAKAPGFGAQPQPGKGRAEDESITGWYRVLYPSVLRAAPLETGKAVTRLQKGTRVRVVRIVKGQWLEIRSISNRPPGFLWWEDAVAEREERAEQR